MTEAADLRRGDVFGILTVIGPFETNDRGAAVWPCRCECGGSAKRTTWQLRSGHTYSCGCRYRPRRGTAADVRLVECEPVAGEGGA